MSGCPDCVPLNVAGCPDRVPLNVAGCPDRVPLNVSGCQDRVPLNVSGCPDWVALKVTGCPDQVPLKVTGCPDWDMGMWQAPHSGDEKLATATITSVSLSYETGDIAASIAFIVTDNCCRSL